MISLVFIYDKYFTYIAEGQYHDFRKSYKAQEKPATVSTYMAIIGLEMVLAQFTYSFFVGFCHSEEFSTHLPYGWRKPESMGQHSSPRTV